MIPASLPHVLAGEMPRPAKSKASCTKRPRYLITKVSTYLSFTPLFSCTHLLEIMGNEILLIIGFTVFSLIVTMAWVGGYLDKYQHTLQVRTFRKSSFLLGTERPPQNSFFCVESSNADFEICVGHPPRQNRGKQGVLRCKKYVSETMIPKSFSTGEYLLISSLS